MDVSNLPLILAWDRERREEQLKRYERAAELQALAAVVNWEAGQTAAQIEQYGKQMQAPDYDAIRALSQLLRERGVLPKERSKPCDNCRDGAHCRTTPCDCGCHEVVA